MLDNAPRREYSGALLSLTFSPDGARNAYTASYGALCVDGKWISGGGFGRFSPDSRSFVCRCGNHVAINGRAEPEYAAVGDFVFLPGGKTIAYTAQSKEGQVFVVVDGKERAGIPGESPGAPVPSPDGKHFAYVMRKPTQWGPAVTIEPGHTQQRSLPARYLVAIDGQPGPECEEVIPHGPTWQSDGSLEYLIRNEGVLYRVRHLPTAE